MRVTNGMVNDQVVFNVQRSLQRFMDLQTSMSSGRRINKPSDDPVGTVRALAYRDQIGAIDQHRKNIAEAQNWSSTYDNALSEAKNFASSAKEIAVAMADGTYDASAREASAHEVQSLFNQLVQMGNSELEGRRIFGGFKTSTKPISVYTNGVSYDGDNGKMDFEIEAASRLTVNLNGSDVFLKQLSILGEKADLNVGVTAATPLADLRNGAGVSLAPGTFTVRDRNRNLTVTIDLNSATPPVTVGDVISRINTQLNAAGVTNLTAQLGNEGNNLLFTSTQDGIISTASDLTKLNGGTGVSLSPGKIHVSNGAGVDLLVDLSGSSTIGDVITKFNGQLAAAGVANVTMAVNAGGRGLAVTDSNGVPLNLTISDVSDLQQTAHQLGISGTVSPMLTGSDLLPVTDFEIAETTGTTAHDLGIVSRFSGNYAAQDMDPRLTTTSLLSSLRNRVGLDKSTISLAQGGTTATIDLTSAGLVTVQDLLNAFNNSGLSITARINPTTRGIEIINNDPNRSLIVEDTGTGRSAKQMGIYGSGDLMGSFLALINALKTNDSEGAGLLLGNLDDGMQNLLNQRATVGARANRLTSTDTRLNNMNLEYTKLLSEAEDADIPKVVTDLAAYENSYQAALMASSKIIQPSLLEFLK